MIKKLLFILTTFIISVVSSFAQPSAVKNVQKSVFSFTTFNIKGEKIDDAKGVFLSKDGEAVVPFKALIGARSILITDYSGKTYSDIRLLGANEMHNIAHIRVLASVTPATIYAGAPLAQGDRLYSVDTKQNGYIQQAAVKSVETFADKYSYYIMKQIGEQNLAGCPLVTEKGEVVGLLEISGTTADIFSTDIRYAQTLLPNMLVASDPALIQVKLPVSLPETEDNARISLMMLSSGDSLKYVTAAHDFMEAYPYAVDAYPIVAGAEANIGNYSKADEIMQNAIKNSTDKASANFEYSKLLYNKAYYRPEPAVEGWTYDKALEYVKAAESISNSSTFRNHEANILFTQQKYAEANEIIKSLLQETDVNKADLYYELARCQQALGASNEELLVLLDSAANNVDSLSVTSAAPYFWMRGQVKDEMKKYREAALDYTLYMNLASNRLTDAHFYTRFLAEFNGRLYQQALVDIKNCLILNPREPLYAAQKAQLELQVNLLEDAVISARYCINIAPESYHGYTLLAIALARQGNKDEAKQNFLKAKELGDENADNYISKYIK